MKTESTLTHDLKPGDTLSLDSGKIRIQLLDKSGKRARLRLSAPRDCPVTLDKQTDGQLHDST